MPPLDSDLLRRFAEEGRQEAFAELVNRRIDLVYAAALRQLGGDAHRAEDIAQQVFITLARKARSLARHPSLLGWLYTSTHYAAVDAIRVEQRRKQREEEAHVMEQLARSATQAADWNQLRSVLDAAMHELNEREVLGDLADKYFEYYWTNDVRWYAQQLAWTGIFTGETISPEQVERAADILIANSPRMSGRGARIGDHLVAAVDSKSLDWPAAKTQLQSVLSPSQIETLNVLIERDKAQLRVDERTKLLTAQFKKQAPRK